MDNISIIGGGIGGLVTALCFEKLDIDYKLYERAENLKEVGAGIWLSPNALQVLEWISPNLLQEIQLAGNTIDRIVLADSKFKMISNSNQQFVKEMFGYTTLAIHRGKLQRILYSYVTRKNIKLGKEFKLFEKLNDNLLNVDFVDDTSILTLALIGADGINSKIRKQVFPKSKTRFTGQTCWRGISSAIIDETLSSIGFTFWGQKLEFGISKIENGKTYWFAVKLSEPNQKDNVETLKSDLIQLFSKYPSIVNEVIVKTPINKIFRGDLTDLKPLERWYDSNICLLGDAAHAMTPDLGQGGAQAIEDAFYLSNIISNTKSIEKAYQDFFIFRKDKVQKLVKQSRMTSKIAITNWPLAIIRNFILKHTPKKYIEKQMIDLYRIDKTVQNKIHN